MPEILGFMGYSDKTKLRNKYLKPLLDDGKLVMTAKNIQKVVSRNTRLFELSA